MKRNWIERRVPQGRAAVGVAAGLLSASGCEDGPSGDYDPSTEVASLQSAPAQSARDAERSFDDVSEGDSRGRARFCDEAEATALIEDLVARPMLPDVSLGGLPLWTPDGAPMRADDLVGLRGDGKFCEPTQEFSNGFGWGPTNEVVVLFNPETRLVTGVAARPGYQGALRASYEGADGEVAAEIRVRERLRLGGVELDEYASRAEQANRGASWLNERNVTQLYLAVRQTFFGQAPSEDPEFNCVASQLCDIIYTSADESVPQPTVVALQDSGVQVNFSPEGQIELVLLDPVRVAPFEVAGAVSTLAGVQAPAMEVGQPPALGADAGLGDPDVDPEVDSAAGLDGLDGPPGAEAAESGDAGVPSLDVDAGLFGLGVDAGVPGVDAGVPGVDAGVVELEFEVGADAGVVAPPGLPEPIAELEEPGPLAPVGVLRPGFVSRSVPGCRLGLANLTWGEFQEGCIQQERTLQRIDFNVHAQRDGVTASFNGLALDFLRKTTERGVLADGEPPAGEDILYSMTVTRSLSAPVAEFVPAQLGALYKARLEAQVQGFVAPTAAPDHPVRQWALAVPPLSPEPQRLAALTVATAAGPVPWLEQVQAELEGLYVSLSPAERAQVDPGLVNPVLVRQPFTHAVLSAVSGGRVDMPGALRQFRTTDDERWSIGFASVVAEGVPYRFTVQYSLNFGAVTALTVERGRSEIDEVFAALNATVRAALGAPPSDYYEIGIAAPGSPLGLGGTAIDVLQFDRRLGTVDVRLAIPGSEPLELTVPGSAIADSSGFLRQIRGERFEFVPSHLVRLLGKETSFDFRVDEAGAIVAMTQNRFKGGLRLCPALSFRYGEHVPQLLESWRAAVGDAGYRECGLVFNYSEDGNVLQSVASVVNRASVGVVAGRAESATVWQ